MAKSNGSNSSKTSSSSEIWRTIDDVNRTLDSISLISGGKPTKTGESHSIAYKKQQSEHEAFKIKCRHEKEKEDLNSCTGKGRGRVLQEIIRGRSTEEKDAILQAELNDLFSYEFFNGNEWKWEPKQQGINGQFDDYDNELIKIDDNIRFPHTVDDTPSEEEGYQEIKSRSCIPAVIVENQNSHQHTYLGEDYPTYFYNQEIDVRSCSPPISKDYDESSSPTESSSENVSSSNQIVNEPSLKSDVKLIVNTEPSSIVDLAKKYRRNALLNSLAKRGMLDDKNVEDLSKANVINLKTPDDFLFNPSKCYSHCLKNEIAIKRDRDNNNESPSGIPGSHSFRYEVDDFPALI